jgi:hypothetical protein
MFLTLGAYTIGMTLGQRLGFAFPLVLALLTLGAAALAGFIAVERRVRSRCSTLPSFATFPSPNNRAIMQAARGGRIGGAAGNRRRDPAGETVASGSAKVRRPSPGAGLGRR